MTISKSDYDLAVIGAGPGGYHAAVLGAQQGMRVLLVEKETLGGTCLNRGCIPTKSFVHDTRVLATARESGVLTGKSGLGIDIGLMVARKNKVVAANVGGLEAIIRSRGIDIAIGLGELSGPGCIKVRSALGEPQTYHARNIILANGSRPAVPGFITVDGEVVQTTDQALNPGAIPDKMAIIGGGVIGMEFASIFQALGAKVTVIEMLPDILVSEDPEIRKLLERSLKRHDIAVHCSARVTRVERDENGAVVHFTDSKDTPQRLAVSRVLVATGRAPVLDGLAPEQNGLAMNGPYVKVNERMETSLPGVFAIGDLVGGMMLAHKASAEAEIVIANLSGHGTKRIDNNLIPRCIWCMPEIAAVGMTEAQALETGRRVRVGRFPFSNSGKAHAVAATEGLVKIVADQDSGEILGVHMIGEHVTELLAQPLLAMTMESAVEDLAAVIMPHPTLSEVIKEAALDWDGRAIHLPLKKG